jgi:hypothetical protein
LKGSNEYVVRVLVQADPRQLLAIADALNLTTTFGPDADGTWLHVTVQARSATEASAAALEAVEQAVGDQHPVIRAEGTDDRVQDRDVLVWVRATFEQLDRWETRLLTYLRARRTADESDLLDIWSAQTERHFALVAASHVITAVARTRGRLPMPPSEMVDMIVALRDIHEHWEQQQPMFDRRPIAEDRLVRAGKRFARSNPGVHPLWWLNWDEREGSMLVDALPTEDVRRYLRKVEQLVIANDPSLEHARWRTATRHAATPAREQQKAATEGL